MRKSILVLMLAAAFAGTTLFAQSERRRSGNTERNTHQTTAETLKKWEEVQTQLKQKYPEKFAEIEKLQKTNIFAALEKMRALARENNVTLPSSGRGGREGFRQGGFGGGQGGEGFRQGGFGGGERGEGFRQGGFGGGQGGFGSRQSQRTTAEEQIKKLYPTEYAEVEKLRVTIEEKLQALAKKGNVTLPESMETLRAKMAAVREKYKTEFAEIDKLRETDPMTAMEKTREIFQKEGIEFNGMGMGMGRGGMTGGSSEQAQPQHRVNPMEKLNQIRQKYPEEFAKIQALRRDNPEEYRKQLQALVAKFDAETAKAK